MSGGNATRAIGDLTFQDVPARLSACSILCLPLGAIEQHGPHLPLNTDLIVAEQFADRIVAEYGEAFDLWRLPAVPLGVSPEHSWAAGTMSLSADSFLALMRNIGREIVRALPARNLLVVNGHGGNRGLLEVMTHEWRAMQINACVIHPLALSGLEGECAYPDIHAGRIETSLMLVFAPELVRREALASLAMPDATEVKRAILDWGVTWGWNSGDRRIADRGVTGNAGAASAEFGDEVIRRTLANVGPVLQRLRENGAR